MTNTKAHLLRTLHTEHRRLILPNAWDVASARIAEEAGAQAIATTSAGVAWCLGTPDGDHLERERAVDVVARIVEAVEVPVTADAEVLAAAGRSPFLAGSPVTLAVGDDGAVELRRLGSGGLRDLAGRATRRARRALRRG